MHDLDTIKKRNDERVKQVRLAAKKERDFRAFVDALIAKDQGEVSEEPAP